MKKIQNNYIKYVNQMNELNEIKWINEPNKLIVWKWIGKINKLKRYVSLLFI